MSLSEVSSKPVLELWKETPFDSEGWDEHSDLEDVIYYVRASKRLKIPAEFRPFLPSRI